MEIKVLLLFLSFEFIPEFQAERIFHIGMNKRREQEGGRGRERGGEGGGEVGNLGP